MYPCFTRRPESPLLRSRIITWNHHKNFSKESFRLHLDVEQKIAVVIVTHVLMPSLFVSIWLLPKPGKDRRHVTYLAVTYLEPVHIGGGLRSLRFLQRSLWAVSFSLERQINLGNKRHLKMATRSYYWMNVNLDFSAELAQGRKLCENCKTVQLPDSQHNPTWYATFAGCLSRGHLIPREDFLKSSSHTHLPPSI